MLAAFLGLAQSAPNDPGVPVVPPPPSWDRFVMLVWQYQTDVTRDRELYESLNLRGFHVDRENGKLKEFARTTGWPFYVDHAAGKGLLHLGKYADPILKKRDVVVRPNSLADPKTIDQLRKLLARHIDAAKGSTAVGYAFDDEVSLGNFCSPVEADGHPLAVAAYRKQLEARYGTIQALNAQYGTSYADFGSVEPRSFEAFRGQLKPDALGTLNLSAWCDWRSAMDTQWADALAGLTRFANSRDASTPAGYVGGHGPSAFGGQDYRKLSASVQWVEAYDIGATNEILRSFWDQRRPRVQTFFSSRNPRWDSWFLWYYLCHGNRGVICWPEGWFKDGKAADHLVANAATFKEIQGPVSKKIVDGVFVNDPIALYYSHPSIQVTWALDAATHGATWPSRSSSMENAMSTSHLTRVGWLKTLEDLGYQARFIHEDHLRSGVLEKEGFKVLVLNRVLCLSDAEAGAIKSFAQRGGRVVADHLCGLFDEHGKARSAGALDDLFGVRHDLSQGILGGRTLSEADAERGSRFTTQTWRVEGSVLHQGLPLFERGLGGVLRKGPHAYLNLSSAGYLLKRGTPDGQAWLGIVSGLLQEAGLRPRVALRFGSEAARATEAIFWRNGERTTLCVVSNPERRASINEFGAMEGAPGEERRKLRLAFDRPVKGLVNERTGKAMGDGREFEDDFVPWEANVYTFAP
jgi:hypothetical protein